MSNDQTTPQDPDYRDQGIVFPDDFVFGSATASYQIEGAVAEDGRKPSIWDTFSHTPGKVVNGDTGDVADDHYHRLDEDLDLMASYSLNAYRFSIAWPRIIPDGRGSVNQQGLDFYNRLIDGLLERGITPTATLYHWDLPQTLEDEGGWPARGTAEAYAEYARVCGEAFGDRITTWTTLNEPWCAAYLGYAQGEHAPGRQSSSDALAAAHHLNLAHGLGLQALRSVVTNDPDFSVTCNLMAMYAEGEGADEALRKTRNIANRIWLDPMLNGYYPDDLQADTARFTDWAFVRDGDLETINQPIDVLGLNYYSTNQVRLVANPTIAEVWEPTVWIGCEDVEFLEQPGPYTDMGWNIKPQGLEDLLVGLHEEWPGLPLVVTENGAAYDDPIVDGRIHDERRIDYVRRHLAAVKRAMDKGAPVIGYYIWSLMDNYEWAQGYEKRFGITHVDYDTLVRTPRDSALWYAQIAATKRVP